MRKNDLMLIKKALLHATSASLQKKYNVLSDWEHIHALKANSWFWGDNGNGSERSRKEKYYGRDDKLKIGKYTLYYYSNVSMSRKNVYWKDGLSIEGMDAIINFGDVRELMAFIKDVLDKRRKTEESGEGA